MTAIESTIEPAPPSESAEAMLLLVASTLTGAPGAVITEVAPTSASTLASLVTSAYAFAPAPAPIPPIEIVSALEVAVLDPFAKTATELAPNTSPSSSALTAPATIADRLPPAAPTRIAPEPIFESDVAVLLPSASTNKAPVVVNEADAPTPASTFA